MASENIKVIAESSSTRTEWALVQGDTIIGHAYTEGLNPFFQTRREISHIIRLGLPAEFFKRRWSHVYYYGAGCSSPEKNKIVESSLVAQFKTPVSVDSDLVGATRGLLVHEPGLACILGTGSNSCLYDGKEIVQRVRSGGHILGDEGTADMVMDEVYNNPHANRNLRNYSFFLADHLDDEYVYNLVYNEFVRFFERTILQYDYKNYPLCFVGSVACKYSEVLLSVPGLVAFHAND